MIHAVLASPTFESFREKARELLAASVRPEEVMWSEAADSQLALAASPVPVAAQVPQVTVPKAYFETARLVAAHRDPRRWALLYSILWRLTRGRRNLLSVQVDPDVVRLRDMRRDVARDIHRMLGFVRFRCVEGSSPEWYVAWYEPDHRIMRMAAPFFTKRFRTMRWSILTTDECAHWDGTTLRYSAGMPRAQAPGPDEVEALWTTYYGATYNPSRTNLELMKHWVPERFRAALPEMQIVPELVADAPKRLERINRRQPEKQHSNAVKQ